jgi:hypothetical protein
MLTKSQTIKYINLKDRHYHDCFHGEFFLTNMNFFFAVSLWLLMLMPTVTAFVASPMPIDRVVFSWVDENGETQSATDTEAPWTLPKIKGQANKSLPYFSKPGKKTITITAFNTDTVIKTDVLEFNVVDTRAARSVVPVTKSDIQSATSPVPVDRVVFSWIDENGISQSATDSIAPWTLPNIEEQGGQMLPYLSKPGKKVITATAFNIDNIIKTEILEFDVIDSRIGRCDNLIKNSDMQLGYNGFWKPSSRGTLVDATTAFGKPVTAIRHSRIRFTSGGPTYLSANNMDYTCLSRGSTWEINAQIGLLSDTKGVPCTIGQSCPIVAISITDSEGNVVRAHSGSEYVGGIWNRNSFNNLKSTFTLPKSDRWNGSVGAVNIEITGYSGSANYIIDNFSILRVT